MYTRQLCRIVGLRGASSILVSTPATELQLAPLTFKMSQPSRGNRVLTMDNLNPNIKLMEYAVRGPIVARAAEIEKELEKVTIVT